MMKPLLPLLFALVASPTMATTGNAIVVADQFRDLKSANTGLTFADYPNSNVPGLDPKQKSIYTEKLLRYSYSLHQMLLDPAPDSFEKSLTQECVIKLREYLNSGQTFYVPEIDQATVRSDQFQRLNKKYGTEYFHRSSNAIVTELAKNQDFNSMYQFLRKKTREYYLHLASIFVADHPTLMDREGPYLIEITPTPDAKFLVFPKVRSSMAFTVELQKLVGSWIQSQHQELLPCYRNGTVDWLFTGNAIDYLALEASGAEWVSHGIYNASIFLFIINPFTIQKMAPSLIR